MTLWFNTRIRSAGAAAANRVQEPRFSSVDDEVHLINDDEDDEDDARKASLQRTLTAHIDKSVEEQLMRTLGDNRLTL